MHCCIIQIHVYVFGYQNCIYDLHYKLQNISIEGSYNKHVSLGYTRNSAQQTQTAKPHIREEHTERDSSTCVASILPTLKLINWMPTTTTANKTIQPLYNNRVSRWCLSKEGGMKLVCLVLDFTINLMLCDVNSTPQIFARPA